MLRNSMFARIIACAAGVSMIVPAMPVTAAPQVKQQVRQGTDVVLSGGKLQGKLLSANGKPIEGAVVAVAKNGKVMAKTVTRADGSYSLSGLAGGTHDVLVADGQFPVRLWSKETAPASAKAQLTVSQTAVRGQFVDECGCPIWGNIAMGALIAGILITTIFIATDDDDCCPVSP